MKNYRYSAPAVSLYFSDASVERLISALDEIAERFQLGAFDAMEWLFPDAAQCLLMIRFEDRVPRQYDEVTRESLAGEVGTNPSAIVRITLNQRHGDDACDAASIVTVHLLDKFSGVVEDGSDEHSLWTITRIRGGRDASRFLAHYRENG